MFLLEIPLTPPGRATCEIVIRKDCAGGGIALASAGGVYLAIKKRYNEVHKMKGYWGDRGGVRVGEGMAFLPQDKNRSTDRRGETVLRREL